MITDLVSGAVNRVLDVPRAVIRGVLSEAIAFLTEEIDLTEVLLAAVDLDRVLGEVNLQAVVERLDLNAVIDTIDLQKVLDGIDLTPILDRLDLNPVLARLDIDAVVDGVDLDKAVRRIDLDAVLAGVDLVVVGNRVINGVDLSSIVRDASSTVTTEMISDVRTSSERADDAVEGFVNRVFRRKSDDD
ncbi:MULTISPECIES: hypothetical protein [Gordonia]|uniref:Uncharacterized protein n=2 Tax=Gordonia TaxID=2053 RepID=L7LEV8_9ACTN|nr:MULTISPECIES: hypothetical protein [Gordonia]AUH69848.1 hypothetical protein CXX93_17970 [Gordonia sp. YC-JH1]KJR07387.1 hypothetical protein UG54_10905 [Gordonia sihwensis]KXT56520.1 hypothetical protein Y710_13640 [Gordonia sp. QH-12]MBY4571593.1 hypothetical protein [Gordonia sihwensis]WFN93555.1 hypothetical protein P5P27_03020 [Gordonia sihwensis]